MPKDWKIPSKLPCRGEKGGFDKRGGRYSLFLWPLKTLANKEKAMLDVLQLAKRFIKEVNFMNFPNKFEYIMKYTHVILSDATFFFYGQLSNMKF